MNKEDHFIDTDKLGDVLLEFSKKISRFSQNIPDTLFGSLTEFLKNIPDDVKNTQLFANVQKLSNYDLNYEDVWWLVDSYGLIDKEDAEEELMEYYEQENRRRFPFDSSRCKSRQRRFYEDSRRGGSSRSRDGGNRKKMRAEYFRDIDKHGFSSRQERREFS